MEALLDSVKIPELKNQFMELGIITNGQNMFQLFEPTLQPKRDKRVFEGKNWKLIINGKLGIEHKNLLGIILGKKYVYDYFEFENDEHLKVMYNKNKIKRYASGNQENMYEKHEKLLQDMMQTSIELKANNPRLKRLERLESMVNEVITVKDFEPPQKMSSLIPEKVTLSTIRFGTMTSIFIENEFKVSYNKNQFGLTSEIYCEISKTIAKRLRDDMQKLFASFEEELTTITYNRIDKENSKNVL